MSAILVPSPNEEANPGPDGRISTPRRRSTRTGWGGGRRRLPRLRRWGGRRCRATNREGQEKETVTRFGGRDATNSGEGIG
uniref:Uncharacterized protein n=1 Tax=Arundo donax TaxID=35708 RepID=A0A0A9E519_ARUDO